MQISPANPREQAIDRFVSILKTKGPRHSEFFLEVLKLSLQQDDYHLGHEHLSEKLAEVICERKRGNEFEVEALVQGVSRSFPSNFLVIAQILLYCLMYEQMCTCSVAKPLQHCTRGSCKCITTPSLTRLSLGNT